MKLQSLRLKNIRCFDDTGNLDLSPRLNIFVGRNNSGKSTLLKAISGLQINSFDGNDVRPCAPDASSYSEVTLIDVEPSRVFVFNRNNINSNTQKIVFTYKGAYESGNNSNLAFLGAGNRVFPEARPNHSVILFLAARKAQTFDQNGRKERTFSEDVSLTAQTRISGTLENLYSRVDLLSNYGHRQHNVFREAVERILVLQITTKASAARKKAGFYFDDEKFIPLDSMGDGVSETLALIVELCTERDKLFVLEEPEMNLHPSGLKALLELIRKSMEENQFFISTHSNVVLRELGGSDEAKIFQILRSEKEGNLPSKVSEVERTARAHLEVLRDLGYEFLDYNLYEGWLLLEESSAETIINEILIPLFVPKLRGVIRTYSTKGCNKRDAQSYRISAIDCLHPPATSVRSSSMGSR
jgi:predicted ATP-dependent endonuclease of OLD family